MWTAAVLEERQRARQQQAATPGAAVDALISGTPNSAPLSTASTALPLRRDAIVRINRWLSAKAASDGLESFDAVPEQATAGQLATHAGLSMPLLDAVGASLPQLLGSGLGLATLKAWQLDALYLVGHPRAAPQLVNTYGRPAVAHAMLQTNMDAAVLAGTSAATTLGLSTRQLLQAVARGSGAGDVRVEVRALRSSPPALNRLRSPSCCAHRPRPFWTRSECGTPACWRSSSGQPARRQRCAPSRPCSTA